MSEAEGTVARQTISAGDSASDVASRMDRWRRERVPERLLSRDFRIWSEVPVPELEDRLGWIDLPRTMTGAAAEFSKFAEEVRGGGVERILLLGMGGSSLAPEVFQSVFGERAGYPVVRILDTTHPDAVRGALDWAGEKPSLYVVSSKSGGTLETMAFFHAAWAAAGGSGSGERFVAITDPGSSLEALARERGFGRAFTAPPDVGGRYSALSPFGLVPAALCGVPVGSLMASARALLADPAPALELGAALGEWAKCGRDKLTFVTDRRTAAMPAWIEQLVAESTGKDGVGILPVVGEPLAAPEVYGPDRVFVGIFLEPGASDPIRRRLDALTRAGAPTVIFDLTDASELGGELLRWEIAVAMAGAVLEIQPFDQPDVQLAKEMAQRVMAGEFSAGSSAWSELEGDDPALDDALRSWLGSSRSGDYLATLSFLQPTEELDIALSRWQRRSRDVTGLASTLGYGPRFLHSTGQLHKGGAGNGLFLQLIDDADGDLAVPEMGTDFGAIVAAQAEGDARALADRGRRLLRIRCGDAPVEVVERLTAAL